MVFHVSPWFISYKTPKYLIFLGFLEKLRANFCQKWVPKLKIAISRKHIFDKIWRKKHARKLKFGQVMSKNDWKNLYSSDFWFSASFWKKMDYVCFKIDFCLKYFSFTLLSRLYHSAPSSIGIRSSVGSHRGFRISARRGGTKSGWYVRMGTVAAEHYVRTEQEG